MSYSITLAADSLYDLQQKIIFEATQVESACGTVSKIAAPKKALANPAPIDEDEDDVLPAKKPIAKKAATVFDDEDEDEDDAPAPKKSALKAPAKKSKSDSVFDDEDDDEDGAPVSKKSAPIKAKAGAKNPRVELTNLMTEIHESQGDEGLEQVREILVDEFKVKKQSELKDAKVPLFIERLREHFEL